MSLENKDLKNWTLYVLGAFIVTALASIYFGYFIPATHPPLYEEAIFLVSEALTFLVMWRVYYDSF